MARSFNGTSSDFITLPNRSALDVTTRLSISAWAYVASAPTSGNNIIILVNGTNFRNFVLDYRNVGGTLALELSNTVGGVPNFGELRANTTLSTNTWHSIVFTADWTQNPWVSTCYVDGGSVSVGNVGSPTTGTPDGSDANHFMGTFTGGSNFWNGRLADIAVWKGVLLTQIEATGLAQGARPYTVREPSIVGFWPLDGLQSPEPDLGGNAMNGTLTGTALALGPPFAPFTPRWPMGSILVPPPLAPLLMPQIVT